LGRDRVDTAITESKFLVLDFFKHPTPRRKDAKKSLVRQKRKPEVKTGFKSVFEILPSLRLRVFALKDGMFNFFC
jgi:hypothetical protein